MKKLLFIGAGRMATAIGGGMVKHGFMAADLTAFDVSEAAARQYTQATSIAAYSDSIEALITPAEVVFLAVKPQFLASALAGHKAALSGKFIISIVAGVSIAKLHELTGSEHIVRVMPNTPALISKGCAGFAASAQATEAEIAYAKGILESVGRAFELPETLLDAVTALSGSGPAYVFEFIAALVQGGTECGLEPETALDLAVETVAGAAALVRSTKLPPAVLCDQVTSPGGTTLAARQVLDKREFKPIIIEAVKAADARSKELGRNA